jgi:hypothetical protein
VGQSRNRFKNLSIDTSFINDWTRSSSPMSNLSMPAMPESYVTSSPCCLQSPNPLETTVDHFATLAFHFDAFEYHQPQRHDPSTFHNNCTF